MTTALNGWGFETNPIAGSSVGGGWFGRGLRWNVFTNDAMKRNTVFLANASPKQTRLPNDNNKQNYFVTFMQLLKGQMLPRPKGMKASFLNTFPS